VFVFVLRNGNASDMLIDQSRDTSGAIQWELARLYKAPDFVKNASHESKCGEPTYLSDSAYAGPNNTFPIHTKAATWLSAAFVTYNMQDKPNATLEHIKNNVKRAAHNWTIGDIVENMFQSKEAANAPTVTVCHALEYTEDGRTKKAYPMRNSREVAAAAEVFAKYHKQLDFAVKSAMAKRILDQAQVYPTELPNSEHLAKCAGYGYTAADTIADALRNRALLLKHKAPELAKQACAVADAVVSSSIDARDVGARMKLAELLDTMDKHNSFTNMYGAELEAPEDVMFAITYKQAADIRSKAVELVTGDIFNKEAFAALTPSDISTWMGNSFADEVTNIIGDDVDVEKLAELAPTLPRPDAMAFKNMMNAHNIRTEGQIKKAFSVFSPGSREELAAAYLSAKR